MRIYVKEIEDAIQLMLIDMKRKREFFDIKDDYYWEFLDNESTYEIYKEPVRFCIGQLSDDISFLRSAIEDRVELDVYILSKLVPILKNIENRHFGVDEESVDS